MRNKFLLLCSALLLSGCFSIPPSTDKAKWYAVVENGGPGRYYPTSHVPGTVCIKIMAKCWGSLVQEPVITTPEEALLYWVNVTGDGPVYRDVALNDRAGPPSPHLGTITIDKKANKVIIDLQRIVSKPGEPLEIEQSPANGTYRIKRWVE